MRTTLTLEPAVAERVRRKMLLDGQSLKNVINDALREGLRVLENTRAEPPKFSVTARSLGLRAGIDPDRIAQYADELEDDETIARIRSDITGTSPG